jgi:hypothetical protein
MAKANAPLFSFGASGKLANALVYYGWKGLNCIRSYVVPANPKTAAQVTQRGYMDDAVGLIHTCQALASNPLDGDDVAALALLASCEATPRTWFNEQVKKYVDCMVAGKTPCIYHDGTISDKTANSIDLVLYITEETADDLAAGKFYFGTSKTALIHSKAATVTGHTSVALVAEDCSAFLTAGEKYFVQFRPDSGDPCEGADSGIYSFIAE